MKTTRENNSTHLIIFPPWRVGGNRHRVHRGCKRRPGGGRKFEGSGRSPV